MPSDIPLIEYFRESSSLLLSWGLNALLALALLIAGFALGRWAQNRTQKRLERFAQLDPTIKPLIARAVRMFVLLLALIAVLAQFGVETTSIIALLGAAGLAIGLSLKDTLSNVASGLVLLSLRPFNVGDWVELGSQNGQVIEIGLFVTWLRTGDGHHVCIPNALVANQAMVNTSRDPQRRMVFVIGVAYDADLDHASEIILSAVTADSRVLASPEPQVFVSTLGDSAIELTVRAWTLQEDYWKTRFELLKCIRVALGDAGISIPFPQSEIRLIDGQLKLARGQREAPIA